MEPIYYFVNITLSAASKRHFQLMETVGRPLDRSFALDLLQDRFETTHSCPKSHPEGKGKGKRGFV